MAKASKTNKAATEQQAIAGNMSVKIGDAVFNAESEYDWWSDLNEAARPSTGQPSIDGSNAERIWGLNPSIL